MFFIRKQEPQLDGTVKVTVKIHSACCKQDLVFIENTTTGEWFDMQTMEPADIGAVNCIKYARMKGIVWPYE